MNTIFENWRIDQLFEDLWAAPIVERDASTIPDDEHFKARVAALNRANPLQTPEQAAELLGISLGASKDEIKKAFRKTMMAGHSDRGGTPVDAAQMNRAVTILNKHAESGAPTSAAEFKPQSEKYAALRQAFEERFGKKAAE